jgi:hypothetical protein
MTTRMTTTLTLAPVPEKYARIYRRRGMQVPTAHSGHCPGALVPYRWRAWHRRYAHTHGLFWLPCDLCGRPFGGHEITDSIPDPTRPPNGFTSICPMCSAERNGGRV